MPISLIINTAAFQRRDVMSSAGISHSRRAYALRNFILPSYLAAKHDGWIDELIVVGEWEPSNGYTYIRSPSEYFNWCDALRQRDLGANAATGDVLIFQHDDHFLDASLGQLKMLVENGGWDILVPARFTRLRNVEGERIPNGESNDYISGHCAIYRREAIKAAPWARVPTVRTWDIEHTQQLRKAGYNYHRTMSIVAWDVENGSRPWA